MVYLSELELKQAKWARTLVREIYPYIRKALLLVPQQWEAQLSPRTIYAIIIHISKGELTRLEIGVTKLDMK